MTPEELLSSDAQELLKEIRDCDGAEIPKPWWDEADELHQAGLITLSGSRGPERWWKRGELAEKYKP